MSIDRRHCAGRRALPADPVSPVAGRRHCPGDLSARFCRRARHECHQTRSRRQGLRFHDQRSRRDDGPHRLPVFRRSCLSSHRPLLVDLRSFPARSGASIAAGQAGATPGHPVRAEKKSPLGKAVGAPSFRVFRSGRRWARVFSRRSLSARWRRRRSGESTVRPSPVHFPCLLPASIFISSASVARPWAPSPPP